MQRHSGMTERSVRMMPRSSTGWPRTARTFDDTFEGGPVHAGAVVVPAVLAIAEHRGLDGRAVARGIAVGTNSCAG